MALSPVLLVEPMTATMNRKAQGFWASALALHAATEHPIHAAWWSGFWLAVFVPSAADKLADGNWLSGGIFVAGALAALANSIRLNRTWSTTPRDEPSTG
jgi:hypothetical protein